MKNIVLLIIISLYTNITFCQVTAEEVVYDYQIATCVGTENSTAWIGEQVVVMIEGEIPEDRDSVMMATIIGIFDDIILKFEEFSGLNNLPIASEYDNKPVIEIAEACLNIDNIGVNGLANNGMLGIAASLFYFEQFYVLTQTNMTAVPMVFIHELTTNFWLPSFNDKFDWSMDEDPQNGGWWEKGMRNAQPYMILSSLGLDLYAIGPGLENWADGMMTSLTIYFDDPQYDFDNGWKQSGLPWSSAQSIDRIMTALLIYSYKNFGEDQWITNFYNQIQNDLIIDRPDVFSYQECRDNIYKIWSFAAEQDLITFFEDDLRWIISQGAKTCVEEFVNSTNTSDLNLNNTTIYPNPASNLLIIESENLKSKSILVYNLQGQIVKQIPINNLKTEIDISQLIQGVYWIKFGNEVFKIVKK